MGSSTSLPLGSFTNEWVWGGDGEDGGGKACVGGVGPQAAEGGGIFKDAAGGGALASCQR